MVVPHFCHSFYLPNSLKPNGIIIPITMRHELFAFIWSKRKFPLNLTGKRKWKPSREKGFFESRPELRLRHSHYPHDHVLTNTLSLPSVSKSFSSERGASSHLLLIPATRHPRPGWKRVAERPKYLLLVFCSIVRGLSGQTVVREKQRMSLLQATS